MMTTADSHHEDAAPSRPSLSRRAKVGVVAGVAAMTAVAAWVGWGQAMQPVRWQDVGFDVSSPSQASVTYEVYLYTDQPVTCYLRALNDRFAEVGVITQDVDPADGSQQRFTTTLVTVEEATTAVVTGCGVR